MHARWQRLTENAGNRLISSGEEFALLIVLRVVHRGGCSIVPRNERFIVPGQYHLQDIYHGLSANFQTCYKYKTGVSNDIAWIRKRKEKGRSFQWNISSVC